MSIALPIATEMRMSYASLSVSPIASSKESSRSASPEFLSDRNGDPQNMVVSVHLIWIQPVVA